MILTDKEASNPRPVELLTANYGINSNNSISSTLAQSQIEVGESEVVLFEYLDTQGVITKFGWKGWIHITEIIVDDKSLLATFEQNRGEARYLKDDDFDAILPLHFYKSIRVKGFKKSEVSSRDTEQFRWEAWRTE
ncbi:MULTISPECIES: hypothetical protein [Pseudoalteromonas]|uniref:Uncharacterized protein n=1 Tax=Pseudoalteromonas amylolytica TaxID=1859457 RepID=A0A1S1MUN1_9GAMM|nr:MULTISPECIES: hypothetical protein [Pseudoalteromonas]OHU87822.1 hypothetical protein BFC16_10435 [Pseudoalteromonas sp. JW3]OHU91262.1 hypothetical protein BET10_10555 [Pseudoalteromonas amylolytica]